MDTPQVTIDSVRSAASRIGARVHRTPLLPSRSLSDAAGTEIRLKCENLQRAGSFKIRGALNALLQLDDGARRRGVVAFSSGNHAQGVALAARLLGIPATIVMPEGSVAAKVEATRAYGATVVQSGVTVATRGEAARKIAAETGASVIPPFDDDRIIAGAGTVGLEIIEEWPEVEAVLVPLGGGGLLAGTSLAIRSLAPGVRIFGVEPAAGDDGRRSFHTGSIVEIPPPDTIADGARTTAVGERNFAIIREHVEEILTVEDDELLEDLRFAVYRTKLLIEPTGALGIAAALRRKTALPSRVAIVVSGGNVDFSLLGR
jgi:threo-3-hydroxy-L-aspartate ammonia-lyase